MPAASQPAAARRPGHDRARVRCLTGRSATDGAASSVPRLTSASAIGPSSWCRATLFLRNAINNGLPALTVPGVRDLVTEGEDLTIDLAQGWAEAGGRRIDVAPQPPMVLDILAAGGLLQRLVTDGYLPAEAAAAG